MRARFYSIILPILLLTEMLDRPQPASAQHVVAETITDSEPRVSTSVDRPRYVALVFHDIVDQPGSGNEDAVTASNLVSFFEWLHANKWTAITLDDIERARSGARPLPDRAVLITFDDGYRSLYTRAYPLLLTYKFPAVAALVGSWMEGPKRETAHQGNNLIPGTDALISWDEAREMAKSGLVEFASHSYDLHHSRPANPQRGDQPAGVTREYNAGGGYETEASYRQRIRSDLEHSRALMQKELGRAPRSLAWPFGRYTQAARQEALAAKYEFLLTMDPEPGFPEDLPQVPRLYPVRDPDVPTMVSRVVPDPSGAVRLIGLNPGALLGADPAALEKRLGAAIERVRALGATTVIVEAAIRGASNRLEGVWFPNRVLPTKADVLSRIVWQMRTRARVQVALSLPVSAARATLGSDDAVLRLFEDLGYSASADALLLDQAPALAAIRLDPSASRFSWEVRRRRNAVSLSTLPAADALALRAFFAFESVRPEDHLLLLTSSAADTPSAIADLTLVEAPQAERSFRQLVDQLAAKGWLGAERRYTSGVLIRGEMPPSASNLSADVRLFQRRGGVAFGWEQDNPLQDEPKATLVAPSVSSARFPLR